MSTNKPIQYSAVGVAVVLAIFLGVKSYTALQPRPLPLEQATVTVSGDGEAVGIPDIATITFSVVEQGDTVAAVTEATNIAMANIVSVMKGAGIADEDIQTTAYNLNPRYDYTKFSRGEIVGYDLTQGVTVKIRALDTIGEVVDAATQAGANDVSSPAFEIDDPEQVKTAARAEAFEKAKAKAESLAAAAGVKLGQIVTFSEDDGGSVYPSYYGYDSLSVEKDFAVGATIEPGSQEVQVIVSVTYALVN
ncbi:MAG: SIMPL domain-containing protein [Candidatus Kerfeldbacteria bacterium]|nr:SIMPL domain-containing protein [Candidatus Kerfeldbacteria bacterium]